MKKPGAQCIICTSHVLSLKQMLQHCTLSEQTLKAAKTYFIQKMNELLDKGEKINLEELLKRLKDKK